ncbi:MAG: hypothetical protein WC379_03340 [Methanoregula sp.]|jgi:hypothetical protein
MSISKICISTVLIHHGGVPSVAAAFIIFGGGGVSPLPAIPEEAISRGNYPILIMSLPGASKNPDGFLNQEWRNGKYYHDEKMFSPEQK